MSRLPPERMQGAVKFLRGITRPGIAWALIIAIIALAFLGHEEAQKAVIVLGTAAASSFYTSHVLAKDG